jgi:UDP-N-acetylmuramoyl-L-alanyl-D-glutamate--2,6-diaminopimelate ligase
MGAAAVSLADLAILTSDNPRSEDPLAILAEMLQGVLTVPPERRGRMIIEPDRAAAIGLAITAAGKGDIVLVAGKGHERGQYAAGQVTPFDDREVAADALAEALAGRGGRDAARAWPGPGRPDPGPASRRERAMEEDA